MLWCSEVGNLLVGMMICFVWMCLKLWWVVIFESSHWWLLSLRLWLTLMWCVEVRMRWDGLIATALNTLIKLYLMILTLVKWYGHQWICNFLWLCQSSCHKTVEAARPSNAWKDTNQLSSQTTSSKKVQMRTAWSRMKSMSDSSTCKDFILLVLKIMARKEINP